MAQRLHDTFAHHFSPNTGLGSPINGLERWNGANLCYSIKVELPTMSLARALTSPQRLYEQVQCCQVS